MRLDTPDARKTGDYEVFVSRLQYGDPEARIILDDNAGLVLHRVTLDDCDRLIKAAAAAKQQIIAVLEEMGYAHGRAHLHEGTCQLCGKPEADELHAEAAPKPVYRLACGCLNDRCECVRCADGTPHPAGNAWHCDEHGETTIAGLAPMLSAAAS
jgi:hypothetical protein